MKEGGNGGKRGYLQFSVSESFYFFEEFCDSGVGCADFLFPGFDCLIQKVVERLVRYNNQWVSCQKMTLSALKWMYHYQYSLFTLDQSRLLKNIKPSKLYPVFFEFHKKKLTSSPTVASSLSALPLASSLSAVTSSKCIVTRSRSSVNRSIRTRCSKSVDSRWCRRVWRWVFLKGIQWVRGDM